MVKNLLQKSFVYICLSFVLLAGSSHDLFSQSRRGGKKSAKSSKKRSGKKKKATKRKVDKKKSAKKKKTGKSKVRAPQRLRAKGKGKPKPTKELSKLVKAPAQKPVMPVPVPSRPTPAFTKEKELQEQKRQQAEQRRTQTAAQEERIAREQREAQQQQTQQQQTEAMQQIIRAHQAATTTTTTTEQKKAAPLVPQIILQLIQTLGDYVEDMINIEKARVTSGNLIPTTISGQYDPEFYKERARLWDEVKEIYKNLPVTSTLYNALDPLVKQDVMTIVAKKDIEAEDMCIICQANFLEDTPEDEVVKLKACTHRFHPDCIKQALQFQSRCPVCRAAVVPIVPTNDDLKNLPNILKADGWKPDKSRAKTSLKTFLQRESVSGILQQTLTRLQQRISVNDYINNLVNGVVT